MSASLSVKSRIERSVQIVRSGNGILPLKNRKMYLDRMLRALRKYSDSMISAAYEDLGREKYDSYVFELLPLVRCLKYLRKHLRSLASERRAGGSWFTFPARYSIVQEPYGVVFIHSCWNYPFLLALEPVAGAIAAGNRVVLKLPLRVPRCVALVRKMMDEVFADDEVITLRDELDSKEIIQNGCDYVFFTGNPSEASEIMQFAASRFIPATLELGGKNPCIVDENADFAAAAKRIVWGKFTNSGQTCIAPDYLVVNKRIKSEFLHELALRLKRRYGDFPLSDSGCGKIVDSRAYQRLHDMSNSGRLIFGGEKDPVNLRISPTVLDQLNIDDPLLNEEVFGPLLGVVEFEDMSDVLKIVRRNPDPLAIYYFGENRENIDLLKRDVRSGALCINDCLLQFANNSVPFGGVGASGMGAYHGKRTFSTFSHSKSVVRQSGWFDLGLRYSGGKIKEKLLECLFRY